MDTSLTHTNERFSVLSGSSDFLNIVLNNISSCVMLLDNELRLRAFNNPLTTIFSNKKNEELLYRKCGEVLGCAYLIKEDGTCGATSKCNTCQLRISALTSYVENKPIMNKSLTKPFVNYDGKIEIKHLIFSTRLFKFKKEKYIITIIDDITELKKLQMKKNNLNDFVEDQF
jgi:sigma-B regulation protein RsbU (phosphoserine phosphatase)